jgi:hypothetical protein
VYAREIDGREFTFGVSGKLSRNVLIMYDRQTESYWSQLIGEAITGEMIGTRLEYLPSWMTTWEAWQEMHPDTLALRKSFPGGADPYLNYYESGRAGVLGRAGLPETAGNPHGLGDKQFVVGVELDEAAVAYPFSILSRETVVNNGVADEPLLVTFDPVHTTHAVFSRTVDGETLTFRLDERAGGQLRDLETGTLWDKFSGSALEGPLAGAQLARLKSTSVFWFGWEDFHPDTDVYQGSE